MLGIIWLNNNYTKSHMSGVTNNEMTSNFGQFVPLDFHMWDPSAVLYNNIILYTARNLTFVTFDNCYEKFVQLGVIIYKVKLCEKTLFDTIDYFYVQNK